MFNNLGWGETAVLAILALLIFGPERLPAMAAKAGRAIRQFRQLAAGVADDLKREVGPEAFQLREELRGLDPKNLLTDQPRRRPAAPTGAAAGTSAASPLDTDEPAPYDPDTT